MSKPKRTVKGAAVEARPPAFSERDLQQAIQDLIARNDSDRATKILIDSLPELQRSKINIKEKLSNLIFLGRAIQSAGGSKYGYTKLRNKIRSLNNFIDQATILPGGFIELGCGAHDPIALSAYFFLNGLEPCYAIDLLPPRVDYFSALSMYDIFANVKMFPGRYTRKDIRPIQILENLRRIDVASFERGDFGAGLESLSPQVKLFANDLLNCDIAPGSISLLTSFAVLEHVEDIDAIVRRIWDLLIPGGLAYHFVDMADHRSYRGDGEFGPHSFLGETEAPPNMNRLRAPEIIEAHRAVGFDVLIDKRATLEIPPHIEKNLLPRLKDMPREDVSAVKLNLVVRKPA